MIVFDSAWRAVGRVRGRQEGLFFCETRDDNLIRPQSGSVRTHTKMTTTPLSSLGKAGRAKSFLHVKTLNELFLGLVETASDVERKVLIGKIVKKLDIELNVVGKLDDEQDRRNKLVEWADRTKLEIELQAAATSKESRNNSKTNVNAVLGQLQKKNKKKTKKVDDEEEDDDDDTRSRTSRASTLGGKGSLFFPHTVPTTFSRVIDPRDTVSARVCGQRANDLLFKLYFRNKVTATVIIVAAAVGSLFMLLSLCNIIPAMFSWACFLLTPFLFCFFSLLNRHVLHRLRREVDFWFLTVLSACACGGFVDMLSDAEPVRIIAAVFLFFLSIGVSVSDARPPFRRPSIGYKLVFAFASFVYACVIALYVFGVWINFKATIFVLPIGLGSGVQLHVPSLAITCSLTLCILTGKYAVFLWRSTETNLLVVMRAAVSLKSIEYIDDQELYEDEELVDSLLSHNFKRMGESQLAAPSAASSKA